MAKLNTDRDLEDGRLIQETLEGNPQAFGQLVRKYQGTLSNLSSRMLGNIRKNRKMLFSRYLSRLTVISRGF